MSRPPLPERSLAVVAPQAAAQLHPTRNGPLDARTVSAGSGARLWWQCPAGHDWPAEVKSRTRGTGCPTCPRDKPTTSLIAGYPELTEQWDAPTNGELTDAVTSGSARRVGWRCSHGHRWAARISSRTGGAGCPYCAGHRATPETSVAARYPQLLAEWACDLNGDLDPATVLPGSARRVWWRCPIGSDHVWQVSVRHRVSHASGCPFCTGTRATPQTSLAADCPALAADWDPTRNGTLSPSAVRPSSGRYAWWRCPAGHSWKARIDQRSRRHTGCPVCVPRRKHGKLLVATRPDLTAQWSHPLNGGGPGTLTTGSYVQAWWRCPTEPTHLWQARIVDRDHGHTDCPYWAHQRPTPTTCLAAAAPQLLPDWHRTRNGNLSPTDVLPRSAKVVWWQCPDGHEWAAAPTARLAGTGRGCPTCAARNRPPVRPPDRPRNPPRTHTPKREPHPGRGPPRQQHRRVVAVLLPGTAGRPRSTDALAGIPAAPPAPHPATAGCWSPPIPTSLRSGRTCSTPAAPASSPPAPTSKPGGAAPPTPATCGGQRPGTESTDGPVVPTAPIPGPPHHQPRRHRPAPARRLASHPQRRPVPHRRPPPFQDPRLVAVPRASRMGRRPRQPPHRHRPRLPRLRRPRPTPRPPPAGGSVRRKPGAPPAGPPGCGPVACPAPAHQQTERRAAGGPHGPRSAHRRPRSPATCSARPRPADVAGSAGGRRHGVSRNPADGLRGALDPAPPVPPATGMMPTASAAVPGGHPTRRWRSSPTRASAAFTGVAVVRGPGGGWST